METGLRTILLVTYEFPPTGGPGVQRLAKFARYLPEHGWRAVVLSAEHVSGRVKDETLAAEVADVEVRRVPARPLNAWVSRLIARTKRIAAALAPPARSDRGPDTPLTRARTVSVTGRPGLAERITRFLGVPDYAALWIGPAVREGVRLGRESGASVVLASGPPFSALVAGMRIARRLGVPFVADFRDAWRDNPGNAWSPSEWHRRRQLTYERHVLSVADVVTTAHPIAGEITDLGGSQPVLLTNGFDSADVPRWAPDPEGPLLITFMGMFYSTRDPLPVFKALQQARGAEGGALRDIRLRIVGQWPAYVEGVIEELDLCGAVELRPYLPHAEALALVASSDVGLIVLADLACVHGTPAKLYEYLGIGLPVLFVGPSSGHAQDLIAEAEGGIAVPYGDVDAIAAAFVQLADLKSAGRLTGAGRPDVVARYERRVQAAALASLLDGLANTTPVSRGGGSEAGHGR